MTLDTDQTPGTLLLWVDDDGPARFPYETKKLQKLGYDLRWAKTGREVVEYLSKASADVVLLDQQLPWSESQHPHVWGGVLLLAWLKGRERPGEAPRVEGWDEIFDEAYHLDAPHTILVLSAFFDSHVAQAREELGVPDQDTFSKPLDFAALRARLGASSGLHRA